jgi:cellulose synthase/poly-beta-1,6-N-acetylglucosamine synthase-like glycosyltransferase
VVAPAVSRLVAAGSLLAAAGAVHAAVNSALLRRPVLAGDPIPAGDLAPDVPVLVPARDEAAHIGACIDAVRGDVVVLDDESTDGTGDLARAAGARVLVGTPPPPGWYGKPWACAQLAAATDSEVLVFVDADVRLSPGAVRAAIRLLDDAELDVICPFPRQVAGSLAERLIQPLLQWSWLTLLPLRLAERSPRPSLAAACGQFVVVRRAALERAGGFAAVRAAVLDDLALVRAVKAAGGRGGVVDGTALASCRMYDGWPALRDGYRKSLWAAFGSRPCAAVVVAALGLAYVVPPLAALRGSRVGALGYAAGVVSRVIAARRTGGQSLTDALAHPLSIVVLGWLTASSWRGRRRGTLTWKSRDLSSGSG